MKQEPTHTVMSYPLAKALMESGMKHYFLGGIIDAVTSPIKSLAGGLTAKNEYNAQLAPQDQTKYGGYITQAGDRALQDYDSMLAVRQQQQALADLLGAEARGEGPNPAQLELAQNTANAIQAQNALQAGQRGAGTNVGLIAKGAAQAGGEMLNTANQNAARLRAEQMLNARRALSGHQATMAQGILGEQGLNAGLLGTAGGLQGEQNANNIRNYGMMQGINSGVASQNAAAVNDTLGGILGAVPGIAGLFKSKPGSVPGSPLPIGTLFSKGGEVPDHLHSMAKLMYPEHFEDRGGKVPGRGSYSGDDTRNDRVPALLSPGEIVLPNSVTGSPDAPKKAAEFIRHLQAKKEMRKSGYEKIASRKGKK